MTVRAGGIIGWPTLVDVIPRHSWGTLTANLWLIVGFPTLYPTGVGGFTCSKYGDLVRFWVPKALEKITQIPQTIPYLNGKMEK